MAECLLCQTALNPYGAGNFSCVKCVYTLPGMIEVHKLPSLYIFPWNMSQHNVAPAKPSFYFCSMKFYIRSEQHWFLQMQNLMKELCCKKGAKKPSTPPWQPQAEAQQTGQRIVVAQDLLLWQTLRVRICLPVRALAAGFLSPLCIPNPSGTRQSLGVRITCICNVPAHGAQTTWHSP